MSQSFVALVSSQRYPIMQDYCRILHGWELCCEISSKIITGKVSIYFKYSEEENAPRGIGIASSAHPLGSFQRLAPAHATFPNYVWPNRSGPPWAKCSGVEFSMTVRYVRTQRDVS